MLSRQSGRYRLERVRIHLMQDADDVWRVLIRMHGDSLVSERREWGATEMQIIMRKEAAE